MSDYTGRAEELLNYPNSINPPLPDEYYSSYRSAAANYMRARNDHLQQLLELVTDNDSGHPDNAAGWRTICNDAVSRMESYFHDQLELVSRHDGPNDLPALGGIAVKIVDEEKQFFARLAEVNAAQMRDRLVISCTEFREFSNQLGELWTRIRSDAAQYNDRQRENYKEILTIANQQVTKLAEAHRTFQEKSEKMGARLVYIATKIIDPINSIAGLGLPDIVTGSGDVGECTSVYLDFLAETHQLLMARTQNYLNILQEEQGGLLPVFRQCRLQVYNYWNEKGTKTSGVWQDLARSSLDEWKSRCATSAQRDDADRFSADVFAKLDDRCKSVKDVADEFERQWRGVFYGPVAAQVEDELVDSIVWQQNAESLAGMGLSDIGQAVLSEFDRMVTENLDGPSKQLLATLETLPEAQKAEAREAIEKLHYNIGSQIRANVAALHTQVAETLNWFQPDAIRTRFDRGFLKKGLAD